MLQTLFFDDFSTYTSTADVTVNWEGGGISWVNGKLSSNNSWQGFRSKPVKTNGVGWPDYVVGYTVERGTATSVVFGSGMHILDYSNTNANNGSGCMPGGYIYMSSYVSQPACF